MIDLGVFNESDAEPYAPADFNDDDMAGAGPAGDAAKDKPFDWGQITKAAGAIGPLLTVAGALKSYGASGDAGDAAKQAAEMKAVALEFQGDQARVNAIQERAAAQRIAFARQDQFDVIASRQLVLMAAGGGGVDLNILSKTHERGAYEAAVANYEGEKRARELRMFASAKDYEARMAREGGSDISAAYSVQGTSNLLSGLGTAATSLFSRYNAQTVTDTVV